MLLRSRIFALCVVVAGLVTFRSAVIKTVTRWVYTEPFVDGVCNYDVSLAIIPPRWYLLPVLIDRINRAPEHLRPAQINVVVSRSYTRFGHWAYRKAQADAKRLHVNFITVADRGPISKLYGALTNRHRATLIIDDDRDINPRLWQQACQHAGTASVVNFSPRPRLLYGSHGYLLPPIVDASALILRYNKTKWGYNDDYYVTCQLLSQKITFVHRPVDAMSFLLSEITESRTNGLIQTVNKGATHKLFRKLCPKYYE